MSTETAADAMIEILEGVVAALVGDADIATHSGLRDVTALVPDSDGVPRLVIEG